MARVEVLHDHDGGREGSGQSGEYLADRAETTCRSR
jgi:hypothetical protein